MASATGTGYVTDSRSNRSSADRPATARAAEKSSKKLAPQPATSAAMRALAALPPLEASAQFEGGELSNLMQRSAKKDISLRQVQDQAAASDEVKDSPMILGMLSARGAAAQSPSQAQPAQRATAPSQSQAQPAQRARPQPRQAAPDSLDSLRALIFKRGAKIAK